MYKFISSEEYNSKGWSKSHPKARCSADGKEYVLSNVGTLTHLQALDHIDKNWPKEDISYT